VKTVTSETYNLLQ